MDSLFGIVVCCENENDIAQLETTINSLSVIDYDKNKVKVVISSSCVKRSQEVVHAINIIKEAFPASEAIFHLNNDIVTQETESFLKIIEATHFVKMKAGGTIQSDLFNKINTIVNKPQDLNACTAVKTECGAKLIFDRQKLMFETDHATIISKQLMQDHYLDFNSYDLAVEHIRNLCIEQGEYEKI